MRAKLIEDGQGGYQVHGEELQVEEGAETLRAITTPSMPSAEEVELHRTLGHIHYRPWFDKCVEGRGRERPHVTSGGQGRTVAMLFFDDLFWSNNGMFSRSEWSLQSEQAG